MEPGHQDVNMRLVHFSGNSVLSGCLVLSQPLQYVGNFVSGTEVARHCIGWGGVKLRFGGERECDELLIEGARGIHIISTNRNIYGFANSSHVKVPGSSETISLTLFENGQEYAMENLHTPIVLQLAKTSEFTPPPFGSGLPNEPNPRLPEALIAVDGSRVYQPLVMLRYRIEEEDVSFHFQLQPQNMDARPQYLLVARHIFPPNLNEEDEKGKTFWAVIPPSTKFYGYRQLSAVEVDTYGPNMPPPKPYPFEDQINVTVHVRGYFSSCNSLSGSSSSWSSYGCNVSAESTVMKTVCACNHLTTFAAGWLVAPNTVDFDYIFRNIDFDKNPTLYATEITIAVIFLLLFIWARRKDNSDRQKVCAFGQ
ncbi:unnamed protein product [Dibothriocephalus latus]|uniref:Uncharacterized protein n=1 Tax=Dibothriocephalus latus TaxID=60516 RepID=A0A3P7LEM8_DIBLA|nr:unnamed protein product [Dibothriocephalus latus]